MEIWFANNETRITWKQLFWLGGTQRGASKNCV